MIPARAESRELQEGVLALSILQDDRSRQVLCPLWQPGEGVAVAAQGSPRTLPLGSRFSPNLGQKVFYKLQFEDYLLVWFSQQPNQS